MSKGAIMRSFSTNETPEKCLKCAHRIHNGERYVCEKHVDGKFVGTIAYSCFESIPKFKT